MIWILVIQLAVLLTELWWHPAQSQIKKLLQLFQLEDEAYEVKIPEYCSVQLRCRHFLFFFFSSRRRHTRLQGDWSSDVCSFDLSLTGYVNVHDRQKSAVLVLVRAW